MKKKLSETAYQQYQKLIFVSQDNLEKFQQLFPENHVSKQVIYNYIDEKQVKEKAEAFSVTEIQNLEDKIESLERRKYKTIRETHTRVDENGVEHTSVTTRRVIDQGVVSRIRDAERRIHELENAINSIISN